MSKTEIKSRFSARRKKIVCGARTKKKKKIQANGHQQYHIRDDFISPDLICEFKIHSHHKPRH